MGYFFFGGIQHSSVDSCSAASCNSGVLAVADEHMSFYSAVLEMQSQKQQNDLCLFPNKPFNITVIQVYAPTSNAEEAEVQQFYEDLQALLELTPKKDILFIIGDWSAKVGSQETPGVTGKFGLGVQNEAGQTLTEFCQENTLVIANTLFQ